MENNESAGFTLLELLIAMAVAGLMLGLALPSASSMIKNQQLQGVLGAVSLAAFTARSEATKSGDALTICARATDSQCGTDWNNGLLVFRDSAFARNEAQAVRDNTDEIIRIVEPHGHDVVLKAVASTDRTAASAYDATYIRYEPGGGSNWENGTFYVCDSRGSEHAVAIQISISGGIRPARRPDSELDDTLKDAFGREISCS
ncbi:MAG: GspH/FimT family pseudopilin [Granulosicoccus sp.]